jgi:hypothetical protein
MSTGEWATDDEGDSCNGGGGGGVRGTDASGRRSLSALVLLASTMSVS